MFYAKGAYCFAVDGKQYMLSAQYLKDPLLAGHHTCYSSFP